MPINNEVINRIEEQIEEEDVLKMRHGYPVFSWKQHFIDDYNLDTNAAIEDNEPNNKLRDIPNNDDNNNENQGVSKQNKNTNGYDNDLIAEENEDNKLL